MHFIEIFIVGITLRAICQIQISRNKVPYFPDYTSRTWIDPEAVAQSFDGWLKRF